MSARMEVVVVVNKFKPKSFVEVGVWRGDLLQLVMDNCSSIEWFTAIDPWLAKLNLFAYNGDDIPRKNRKDKRYTCTMSEPEKTQEELDAMYVEVVRRFSHMGERMTVLRAQSKRAAKLIGRQQFDFIYVDALHLYEAVKEDITLWLPKVKPGGILAGDDYHTAFPGVMKGVDEMLPDAEHHGRVWYYKKKSTDK